MKYALKEWNTTVEALGKGQIVGIWRKGGLGENFTVERNKFILFPTFTHQSQDKVKKDFWLLTNENTKLNIDNQVRVKYWAEVEETIPVETLEQLLNASGQLVNNEEHLTSSWNLSPNHPGKILLLRVYKLCNPILITNSPEYDGCKSWIELKIDIPKTGSKSVSGFRDFQTKVRHIKALLEQKLKVTTIQEQPLILNESKPEEEIFA